MHNDSKLGLLAGVAGVIVAATMISRPPASQTPEAQAAPSPAATPATPAAPPKSVASAVPQGRPEIEGKTASRMRDDDE